MLFSGNIQDEFCKKISCPNMDTHRTLGICIKKENDDFVITDSISPSIVIFFRDPTIEKKRSVDYVLDLNGDKRNVSSRLFNVYVKYLLQHFPEDEIIYLDNFVRCSLPLKREELSADYINNIEPYAKCCFEVSRLFFMKLSNIKCLIFSGVDNLVWLEKKGLLKYQNKDIKEYFDCKANSTILLGESFEVNGWDFPIFFFPHPVTFEKQYETYYALGKPYHSNLENGREEIMKYLK